MNRSPATASGLLLAAAAVAVLHAQGPPAFRFERPVKPAASGAQRLAIDLPLLVGGTPFAVSGSRPRLVATGGLSDLRFFAADGLEVPYLLVYSPSAEPPWQRASVLPVAATEKTSGFEADFGESLTMDKVRVERLPAPFLKRLVLEGSGDRERWTLLTGEGTLFDLPAEQLRQTELPFAAGTYRYLRVTWDDTNSGRVPLPQVVAARRVAGVEPPPRLAAPLAVERRPSEPGRSRYRIRLPAGRLPITSIELQVAAGHVFRDAIVYQSRLEGNQAAPSEVGRVHLRRVVRDGVTADSLRIPVSGIVESELDLVVEDAGNPPLALTGATATFAELPWIYVETAAASLTARYGNVSLKAPVYDLEAVRENVAVRALPEAQWGEPRPSAGVMSGATPPPTLPEVGAAIDAAGFRHVRALPDGDPQLVALVLDAAVLAQSDGPRGGFADVRVLDSRDRQVPYLIERRDEPMPSELRIAPAPPDVSALNGAGHTWSSYLLELPYENLPDARLVIETSARVFHRPVRLAVQRPADRHRRERWLHVLTSDVWTHVSQEDAAPALTLAVPQTSDRTLVLSVDEGDNQPLPLTKARLLLPTYRLRFYRPAGAQLRLAYGREDLSAPRYDLALLAPHVIGVEAREIIAGSETAPAVRADASFISPRMFWLLLGFSVVLLLALIARLVAKG